MYKINSSKCGCNNTSLSISTNYSDSLIKKYSKIKCFDSYTDSIEILIKVYKVVIIFDKSDNILIQVYRELQSLLQ